MPLKISKTIYKITPLHWAILSLNLCSVIFVIINEYKYHFPGNHYTPWFDLIFDGCVLSMIYGGCRLHYGINGKITKMVQELMFLIMVLCSVSLATDAVQFTPFQTIDQFLLNIDRILTIDLQTILHWTQQHPLVRQCLVYAYNSIFYQIIAIPLILIACQQTQLLRDFYFLILVSTCIGFSFYYFFPTAAPASLLPKELFIAAQHATHLKFTDIHHYIQPSTQDGGLIGFPSFHVIWAWLCTYITSSWRWVCVLLGLNNIILALACMMLGWHYGVDLLGSAMVLCLAHGMLWLSRRG